MAPPPRADAPAGAALRLVHPSRSPPSNYSYAPCERSCGQQFPENDRRCLRPPFLSPESLWFSDGRMLAMTARGRRRKPPTICPQHTRRKALRRLKSFRFGFNGPRAEAFFRGGFIYRVTNPTRPRVIL